MEGNYEVFYCDRSAGKVQLFRQGLYYRVICRCKIPDTQICRLYAVSQTHRENLGVVVPDGEGFILDKKVPVKRLGEEKLRFVLAGENVTESGIFVPIAPEEPFAYIERLKTAFLQSENGQIGIRIGESPKAV